MNFKKSKNKKNSTFIIAEMSANHNNNFDLAVKTIESMAEVGADAVKLQTYTADTRNIDCDKHEFLIKGNNLGRLKFIRSVSDGLYPD